MQVFSTSRSLAREGGASWADLVSSRVIDCDVSITREDPAGFNGNLVEGWLGDVRLTRLTTSGAEFYSLRSSRKLRLAPEQGYLICLALSDGLRLTQSGREIELAQGDLTVVDVERAYDTHVPLLNDSIWVRASRAAIEGRLGRIDDLVGVGVTGGDGLGRIAGCVLRESVMEVSAVGDPHGPGLANSVLDLVCAALSTGRSGPMRPGDHRVNTLRRARQLIELRLQDETLSPASVAKGLGLSTRYLSRLFHAEGVSPARWIWSLRLERCRETLVALGDADRPISDIALSNGFKNLSHFNRAFRGRYGLSPTETRRRARGDCKD